MGFSSTISLLKARLDMATLIRPPCREMEARSCGGRSHCSLGWLLLKGRKNKQINRVSAPRKDSSNARCPDASSESFIDVLWTGSFAGKAGRVPGARKGSSHR